MHLELTLLLANFATAWFMTGLIWFVQLVHYPQFSGVGSEAFIAYHQRHTRMTTWVVGPPMFIEAASSVCLVLFGQTIISPTLAWVGLSLLVIIWLSTVLLQVPKHDILARGWDLRAGQVLCRTNWIRTIFWTVRALLLLYATGHLIWSRP